jgi:hypothetical protein
VPEPAAETLGSQDEAIKNFRRIACRARKPGNEILVSQGWDEPRRALNDFRSGSLLRIMAQ